MRRELRCGDGLEVSENLVDKGLLCILGGIRIDEIERGVYR